MVLKIEEEVQEILQSVGVRQGGNMAPVLFLILVSAAAETLEVKSYDRLRAWTHSLNVRMYNSANLTPPMRFFNAHVDDGAFPFPDQATLIAGMILIHSHFAHLGRDGEPSETECVFSPPPNSSIMTTLTLPPTSPMALLMMTDACFI